MAFYDINSIVIVCVFLCGLHKFPRAKRKRKKQNTEYLLQMYYMFYVRKTSCGVCPTR